MWINLHTHLDRVSTDTIEVYQWNARNPEVPFKNDLIVYSVGFHPSDSLFWNPDSKQKLIEMIEMNNVVFIGEIGLDGTIPIASNVQNAVFLEQLTMASYKAIPVILHIVKRYDALLQIKKKFQHIPAWVIHGFRGKPALLKQLLDHGFYISFGVKFNEESLKQCPLNRLFLETDMSAQTLPDLYKKVAESKGCHEEVLKEAIFTNYMEITANKKGVNHIE